jgi:autoaggregation protein RapA/B/C
MAVNHKPVAGDAFVATYDVLLPIDGNILMETRTLDDDGDVVRVNFVNGQRLERTNDPDNPGITVIEGKYGTLTVDETGDFFYRVDPTDPEVLALGPGDAMLVDHFTFKISDGKGATDFGLIDFAIDIPDRGIITVDFEDADRSFPWTYKGLEWGHLRDGDYMPLRTGADGNHFITTGVFTSTIRTADGHDVSFDEFTIANLDVAESVVTFVGLRDNDVVGETEVSVSGQDLATGQHVSLTDLGLIDTLRIYFDPIGNDPTDPTHFPRLMLDDFVITA